MSETEARRGRNSTEKWYKKYLQNGAMDLSFFITVIALVSVGLVMLYTASYAKAYYYENNSGLYFFKQAQFAGIGIVAMLIISRISVKFVRKMLKFLYPLSVGLLILALVTSDAGFKRWVVIAGQSFQPSELAKFVLILTVAHFGAKYYPYMKSALFTALPLIAVAPLIGLTAIAPHMSATIIMLLMATVIIIVAGANLKLISGAAVTVGALGVAVLGFSNKLAYAFDRVKLWLGVAVDTVQTADDWQTRQAIYALGSGGLLGQGFGDSTQKHLYMPEPQNDFIFAVIGEELGFLGAVAIIALFGYFVYRGFLIAIRARDKFSSLLAIGITFHIGLQAALNLMVVSNVIPNTGISLPFFSYGGTSLLMTLGEMGIMLSISRASTVRKMTSKS